MKKLKLNKHNNECVCLTEHNNNSKRGISYKQQYQPYHQQQQLLTDRYSSLRTTTQLTHGNYSSTKSTDRYTVDVLQGMNDNNNDIGSYINNINLKLRLDINRNIPIYVDKYNLTKTVKKFTISNYNNKYNIYYKKHQNLPSIRSINRTSKYNIWQSIFIQSLRDKQRNEYQPLFKHHHHYKHKSDLPYIHL